jgi:hypothetical protein
VGVGIDVQQLEIIGDRGGTGSVSGGSQGKALPSVAAGLRFRV